MNERLEILRKIRDGSLDVSTAAALLKNDGHYYNNNSIFYINYVYKKSEIEMTNSNLSQHNKLLLINATEQKNRFFLDEGFNTDMIGQIKEENAREISDSIKASDKDIVVVFMLNNVMSDFENVEKQIETFLYEPFYLAKELQKSPLKKKIVFYFISETVNSKIPPVLEAVSGFMRCLIKENPHFSFKTIAVPQKLWQIDNKWFLKELENKDEQIVYSDNLERLIKKASWSEKLNVESKIKLKSNGTYIVIGGLGGVGLIVSKFLRRKYNAKLVLTGRKPLNDEIKKKIESNFEDGGLVIYYQSDISDKQAFDWVLTETERNFGSIDGVIHCAGIVDDSLVVNKQKQRISKVIDAKIFGTNNIFERINKYKDVLFVLMSSNTAIFGNAGQSDYGFANAYLNGFAEYHKDEMRIVSVDWPFWKEGGMEFLYSNEDKNQLGVLPLESADGCNALEAAIDSGKNVLSVLSGDKTKLQKLLNSLETIEKKTEQKISINCEDEKILAEKAQNIVKEVISKETKLPVSKININDSFEKFGIDSLMVTDMTKELEAIFGTLSKTLFFEYANIKELATYLASSYPQKLISENKTGIDIAESNQQIERIEGVKTEKVISDNSENDDIAIIGISIKAPKSEDQYEFWENLKNGMDCITEIPKDRWNHSKIYDPQKGIRGKSYSKWGGFIDDVDKFDPLFFQISPLEAKIIDPQERLFLENVWHLFEDAGYRKKDIAKKKIGVYVGIMYGQYQILGAEETLKGNPVAVGSTYASVANRVSYFFDLKGPSMAIDTMCSSSLTTVHLACESIKSGESTMAIAGGVNLSIHPSKYLMLSQGGFASTDGRCRSFGDGGDGYVPGEGVGCILLKSLSQAKADGDMIYAVIKGSSINHVGKTSGYTVPSPVAQADVISDAIRKSNIDPKTIGYIEAHGTGTLLGDPIEINGLQRSFGSVDDMGQKCAIGSLKSNFGHLESAAGIAGLIKVVLQLKHKTLVPSIHSDVLNKNIDFDNSHFYVQRELKFWKPYLENVNGHDKVYPRRAGVSAFGAGGSNGHIILEEYDNKDIICESKYDMHEGIFIISAHSKYSLEKYVRAMHNYVSELLENNKICSGSYDNKNVENDIFRIIGNIVGVETSDLSLDTELDELSLDSYLIKLLCEELRKNFSKDISVDYINQCQKLSEIISFYNNYQSTDVNMESDRSDLFIRLIYTLQTKRENMKERISFVAHSLDEVKEKLEKINDGINDNGIFISSKQSDTSAFDMLDQEERDMIMSKYAKSKRYEVLAKLWTMGEDIDWQAVLGYDNIKKIKLPLYPFEKERCWLPQTDYDSITHLRNSDEIKFYQKSWMQSEISEYKNDVFPSALIILTEKSVITFLEAEKHIKKGIIVFLGEKEYNTVNSDCKIYYLDIRKDDYYNSVEKIIENEDFEVILDFSEIDYHTVNGLYRYVFFIQKVLKSRMHQKTAYFKISNGLEELNRSSYKENPVMASLAKISGSEYRNIFSKKIDYDDINSDHLFEILYNEYCEQSDITEVLYNKGIRYVPYLKKINIKSESEVSRYKNTGLYIISGGLRGIGAMISRHLAYNGGKYFMLMGVKELPPKEQWQNKDNLADNEKEKIELIEELEKMGCTVWFYTGTISNSSRLRECISEAVAVSGGLNGVVHCAGYVSMENPSFINKNEEELARVFEPKINALEVLHEMTYRYVPEFFVLFSSVSSVFPRMATGLSFYSAANSYMDYFAEYKVSEGNDYYCSINWPNWNEGGMGKVDNQVYQESGLKGIHTEEALEAFDYIVNYHRASQIIVLKVNEDKFDTSVMFRKKMNNFLENSFINGKKNSSHTSVKEESKWLKKLVAETLFIAEEKIDDDVPLGEYGVDSILVAELVKKLEERLDSKVEPSVILENQTISQLSSYIESHYNIKNIEDSNKKSENTQIISNIGLQSVNTVNNISHYSGKIAVVGMACNFPKSPDIDIFWEHLQNGDDCISEVPVDRWDINEYYSCTIEKGKSISKWGGFIEEIEMFDPEFFMIKKEEAAFIDPSIRLMLEITDDVINDAGYDKKELSGKNVSVFTGARIGQYAKRIKEAPKNGIIGAAQNFITAYVSHIYNFKGTSIMVDTACSSSLVGIELACRDLLNGDSDISIAGGVDVLLDQNTYLVLSEAEALSPDGKCYTFDEKANGFVPGEGCGAVMLKRYEDAVKDGNRIYAVIEGAAMNNDGRTMGATTPNPEAQADVIKKAYEKSGVSASEISYIEAHGTATMIGDPIELKALTRTFSNYTDKKQFCGIGSVKTNIGHLLSAAGISAFIKTALCIYHKELVPTLNCTVPNPRFDFKNSPFFPVLSAVPWRTENGRLYAGISSFGFGGTNAHIVLSNFDEKSHNEYKCIRERKPKSIFDKKRYFIDDTSKNGILIQKDKTDLPKRELSILNLID